MKSPLVSIEYNKLMIPKNDFEQLDALYDKATAEALRSSIRQMIGAYRARLPRPAKSTLDEKDTLLITYADQVSAAGEAPLATLNRFCQKYLNGLVSGLHILPFYPWSSDDGFAVKDYRAVNPAYGTWQDMTGLSQNFRLMFDGVINHISAESDWFQGFLKGKAPYRDYFITLTGAEDLSGVVRPRALPLLHDFETADGPKHVWTTFSADQIDLNYQNPAVMLEILDILLGYVERGADFLRLDAIGYLWKVPGTSCINLPQTHQFVQLLHEVLHLAAPYVRLITETNIPHVENVRYFGDGHNEAQLVYNFALPPLVLHSFLSSDATILSDWAASLQTPSDETHFFNFLASHDGIGLNPVRGILSEAQIEALVARTLANGGHISYKQNNDGSQSPYEMNINYFDALLEQGEDLPQTLQVRRFLTAQAILLSLKGLPGIYFHSLFGSRGWQAGVALTGRPRSINREKLSLDTLQGELANPSSLRAQVFEGFRRLLAQRAASAAFHPQGGQEVLDYGRSIFALRRTSPDRRERMLCLHNVSGEAQRAGVYELAAYASMWVRE